MINASRDCLFQEGTTVTLPSGLRLLVHPSHPESGVVSLQIWVGVGSALEAEWAGGGLSHWVEHMVFKGTAQHSAREINLKAESLGGLLNAYTSYDRTVYHMDAPAEAVEEGLALLTDFVFSPLFRKEDLAMEKEVILREMAMLYDDPSEMLFQETVQNALPKHPARFPIIGVEEQFKRLGREDLSAFHTRFYQPNNAFIVIAGDVQPDFPQRLGRFFPEMKIDRAGFGQKADSSKRQPTRVPSVSGEGLKTPTIRCGDWDTTEGLVLFPVPLQNLQDYERAEWVTRSLAGSSSSLLNKRMRVELGLVHQIHSSFFPIGGMALICVDYQTDPDRIEETERVLMGELSEMGRSEAAREQIREDWEGLTFGRTYDQQTAGGVADLVGERELLFSAGALIEETNQPVPDPQIWRSYCQEWLNPQRACIGRSFPSAFARTSAK